MLLSTFYCGDHFKTDLNMNTVLKTFTMLNINTEIN